MIDYILILASLISHVVDFTVGTPLLSDHLPLQCSLSLDFLHSSISPPVVSTVRHTGAFKIKWDSGTEKVFDSLIHGN